MGIILRKPVLHMAIFLCMTYVTCNAFYSIICIIGYPRFNDYDYVIYVSCVTRAGYIKFHKMQCTYALRRFHCFICYYIRQCACQESYVVMVRIFPVRDAVRPR